MVDTGIIVIGIVATGAGMDQVYGAAGGGAQDGGGSIQDGGGVHLAGVHGHLVHGVTGRGIGTTGNHGGMIKTMTLVITAKSHPPIIHTR